MKTIYLCGPINGRSDSDCRDWREHAKSLWAGEVLDPMRRDYRGRELEPGIAAEIVEGDMIDLGNTDVLLVYFDKPSVGTSMEVYHFKAVLRRPVVIIDVSGKPLSPWLTHHSDVVCASVDGAIEYISRVLA
jgi:hypothetical protein